MTGLVLSSALFSVGFYGVLVRRDIIGVFASIEVMLGGALLLLVTVGGAFGARTEAAALLVLVVAAAEAALGLALLVAVARSRATTRIDELTEVNG